MGDYAWLFQWSPLLYTVFWFITPIGRHSSRDWILFAVFYLIFVLSFFQVFGAKGKTKRIWLGVLFLVGYLYFPFNNGAAGMFVYPVVMSVFFLRQPKALTAFKMFAAILVAQAAGILLETRLVHAHLAAAESAIFYAVAIGLGNFAFSRHVLAREQLEQANLEIEHLTQLAERERIARDLHDLLGHTLTVIVLKADIANRLFTEQPELAHREIAEVESTARQALAEVREAVYGYRAEGLAAELLRARRALTSAGAQLTADIEHIDLPVAHAATLCLVLREAVTNIIRHAGATACRLELRRDGGRIIMIVEDNGSGELGAEGNGLRGMRERIASLAGTLQRQRSTLGGYQLLVELPQAAVDSQPAEPLRADLPKAAFDPAAGGTVRA